MSKILLFSDVYWERLYCFLKFLLPKIKLRGTGDLAKGILEVIDLDSYRLSVTTKENIKLKGDEKINLTPPAMKGKNGNNEFNTL